MVTYTNESTGSGTLTYYWNFGNSQYSTLETPWSINYLTAGTYTVSLTVSNGSQSDTYSAIIQVFAKPVPLFSFSGNTQGCLPIVLNFTDNSQPGNAPINQWNWEFGDGGFSAAQNPVYSFSIPGTWSVMLEVTDTNGCSGTTIVNPVAHVSPIPAINVVAVPSNGCVVPTTVQFNNNTSGLAPLSYNWNFGDGGVSTQQSPSHIYNQLGVFNVSLTVTDPNGCTRDTIFGGMVNMTGVNASFTTSTGSLTVCPKQWFNFVNTSGTMGSYWIISGGGVSSLTNPPMVFNLPGTYQVTLISAPFTVCADTITQTITVEDFQASIITDPASMYSCDIPAPFYYSYGGPPASQYHWIIEDQYNVSSPLEVFSSTSMYSYMTRVTDSYNVILIATSLNGCIDTVTAQIYIDPIIAYPLSDIFEGCVPLNFNFFDTSYSHEPIISWLWEFPDNTTSTSQTPSFMLDTAGYYGAHLTVVNSAGCDDERTVYFQGGYHHIPAFDICFLAPPYTDTCRFCPWDSIKFQNLTTDTAGNMVSDTTYQYVITSIYPEFSWFFGEIGFDFYKPIPYYFASNDTGWQYNLALICNYFGCRDTVIYDEYNPDSIRLYVNGPLIQGVYATMSCDLPLEREFIVNLIDAEYWNWDLGDGTVYLNTNDTVVYHIYADTGYYQIICTAFNDSTGCIFADTSHVLITDIKAIINPPGDTICRNTSLLLDAWDSEFNIWNQWTVNGTTVQSNMNPLFGNMYYEYTPPVFTLNGDYPAILVVHDIYNCYDTAIVNIHVTEPAPSFVTDTSMGCAPLVVEFTSTSYSDIGVETVVWNFGDGSPNVTGLVINHTFLTPDSYDITLTVTDSLGCVVSQPFPQHISTGNVNANFISYDRRICIGDTLYLVDISTGSQLSYVWNFGNGIYSTAQHPMIIYNNPGFYDVSLIIHDNLGCVDTFAVTDFFEVQEVSAHFLISNTDTNCYPFRPVLDNLSPLEFMPQCEWNYGDGFLSYNYNPVHSYTQPGNYWLSLTVTTSEGCTASDSVFIHVGGPYAEILISDSLICAGDEVSFYLTDTVNISNVNWNFGDGSGTSSFSASHVYAYVPPGNNFYASLIYCSEPSCCVPAEQYTIGVYEVIAGFEILNSQSLLPDTASCPPSLLLFNNTSFGASSWEWNFGNGQVYSGETPSEVLFENESHFPLTLTATQSILNDIGCADSTSHQFIIYGTPPILLSNDTIICLGNNVQINAFGGNEISWYPHNGLIDTVGYSVVAQPDSSIQYFAEIHDTLGCANRDSMWVFVQQIPQLIYSNDTSIIIGEIVNLAAVSDQNSTTVQWTPSEWINCSNCHFIVSQPLEDVTYTITLQDSLGCFLIYGTVNIDVIEEYSLDLPVVFTPNGDGTNDRVFVRGWGIMDLLEFSIYNRWGERIYFSDDLYDGWDGTFNDKPQNIDTYSYYVRVRTYGDKILDKKGNITLLR